MGNFLLRLTGIFSFKFFRTKDREAVVDVSEDQSDARDNDVFKEAFSRPDRSGSMIVASTINASDSGVAVNQGTFTVHKRKLVKQTSKEEFDLKGKLTRTAEDERRKDDDWNLKLSAVLLQLGGCGVGLFKSLLGHGFDPQLAAILEEHVDKEDFVWRLETVLRWCRTCEGTVEKLMQDREIVHSADSVSHSGSPHRLNMVRFRLALLDHTSELQAEVSSLTCEALNFPTCDSVPDALQSGTQHQCLRLLSLLRYQSPSLHLRLLSSFLSSPLDCPHRNRFLLGVLPPLPSLLVPRPRFEAQIRAWLDHRCTNQRSSPSLLLAGAQGMGKTVLAQRAAVAALEAGFACVVWLNGDSDLNAQLAVAGKAMEMMWRSGEFLLAVVDDAKVGLQSACLADFHAVLTTGARGRDEGDGEVLKVDGGLTEAEVGVLCAQAGLEGRMRQEAVRMCAQLDFLPLAVGLMLRHVARTRGSGLSEGRVLAGLEGSVEESVRVAVTTVVERATEAARTAFLRLSVIQSNEIHLLTAERLWHDLGHTETILHELIDLHLLLPSRQDVFLLHSAYRDFLVRQTSSQRRDYIHIAVNAYRPLSRIPDEDHFFHGRFAACCLEMGETELAVNLLCDLGALRRRFRLGCGDGVVQELDTAMGDCSQRQRTMVAAFREVVGASAADPDPADSLLRRALMRSREEEVFQQAMMSVDVQDSLSLLRLGHAPLPSPPSSLLPVWREMDVCCPSSVLTLSLSPDHRFLLLGLSCGRLLLLDPLSHHVASHDLFCRVLLARFLSPDLLIVATTSESRLLAVREWKRRPRLEELGDPVLHVIRAASASPTTLWLLVADDVLLVFDLDLTGSLRRRYLVSLLDRYERVLVSEDGRSAVLSGGEDCRPLLLLPDGRKSELPVCGRVEGWSGRTLLLSGMRLVDVETMEWRAVKAGAVKEAQASVEWEDGFLVVAGDWGQKVEVDGRVGAPMRLSRRTPGGRCVVMARDARMVVCEETGVVQMYDTIAKKKDIRITPVDAFSSLPLSKSPCSGFTKRLAVASRFVPALNALALAVIDARGLHVQLAFNRRPLLDFPLSLTCPPASLILGDDRVALAAENSSSVTEIGLDGRAESWSAGRGLVLALTVSSGVPQVVAALQTAYGRCRVSWRHLQPSLETSENPGWTLVNFSAVTGRQNDADSRAVILDVRTRDDWRRLTVSCCIDAHWTTVEAAKLHCDAQRPYAISHTSEQLALLDRRGRVHLWALWPPRHQRVLLAHYAVAGNEMLAFVGPKVVCLPTRAGPGPYYVLPEDRRGRLGFPVREAVVLDDERLLVSSEGRDALHVFSLRSGGVVTVFRSEWGEGPREISVLAASWDGRRVEILVTDSEKQLMLLTDARAPIGEERVGRRSCVVS